MKNFEKKDIGVVNTDYDAYRSAKKRKEERKKLSNLYKEFEELKSRVELLEKLNK